MSERDIPETQSQFQRTTGDGGTVAVAGSGRVAIVCAMEREVAGLVKGWRVESAADGFKRYKVFENERATVVVAGIGRAAASHAAELALERSRADVLISAGFAGATVAGLYIGNLYTAAAVVDAESGTKYQTLFALFGAGVLATASSVLGSSAKQSLYECYGAHAVDMEAAAVAEVAQRHGVGFLAVKAISDLHDFAMPPMQKFVDERGDFHTARFVAWMALRPGTWGRMRELNRNSRQAAANLSNLLNGLLKLGDLRTAKFGEPRLVCNPPETQRR